MNTKVKTQNGMIEGVRLEGCTVFRGVPYAEPPTGKNRWKAPVPKKNWKGIRKADTFAAIAPQRIPDGTESWGSLYYKEFYAYPQYRREQSEDCLYLNIWVPDHEKTEKLPVAFWIHGGGFAGGYSSEIEFGGEAYAKQGVILVTVEYRLGIFGFLAHPWLSEENERHISGNYGILDQIEALRWVRDNIEAFGGDPENITVFGQSAGSMSTQVLVSSELTGSMISKAILQSGISCEEDILYQPTLKEAESIGEIFAEIAGVSSVRELRALSTAQILNYHDRLTVRTFAMGKGLVLVPNADGYVLPDTVSNLWKEGKIRPIPYLAGCVNSDLGSEPEKVERKQPGRLMEECVRWSLKAEEDFGIPSYVYYFSHDLPGDGAGAFHSSEIWYTMGTLNRWWRPDLPEDQALSAKMVQLWTDFMKTGCPESDPEWRPCSKTDPYVKSFQ